MQAPLEADLSDFSNSLLDNQKHNLRYATTRQNQENRLDNKSGYPGVWLDKRYYKWQAYATINYRKIYLGLFSTAKAAYEARQNFLAGRTVEKEEKEVQKNNVSGYSGVYLHKKTGKWAAQTTIQGKKVYIGTFSSPQEAYAARVAYLESLEA